MTGPDPATVSPSSLVNQPDDLHTSPEMEARLPVVGVSAELPKQHVVKA